MRTSSSVRGTLGPGREGHQYWSVLYAWVLLGLGILFWFCAIAGYGNDPNNEVSDAERRREKLLGHVCCVAFILAVVAFPTCIAVWRIVMTSALGDVPGSLLLFVVACGFLALCCVACSGGFILGTSGTHDVDEMSRDYNARR